MEKKIANGRYVLKQVLGTGSFGKVYYSSPYAIKEISMALPPYLRTALDNEIKILMSLSHPNIVRLIEVIYEKEYVYIVMEYCEEDLTKSIKSFVGNEDKAKEALRQIILGFKELNKIGIVHRDLKPANILVNKGLLKLADFGFAKFV
jgi:serine/threonine-protein kinase ULK/ATG1